MSLLREFESAASRIADLVKAVKAYSYMDRADIGPVDLRRGLEDTLRLLQDKLEGITSSATTTPPLPIITGHGGQLYQV